MENLTQSEVNEIFDKVYIECNRIAIRTANDYKELQPAMSTLLSAIETSLNQSFQDLFEPF